MDPQRFDRFTKSLEHRLSRRSTLLAGAGLALTGASVAPATAQGDTPVSSPPAATGLSWLLLQRFASATLSPVADGATLILDGVEPTVLAFTDHPARLTRALPAAQAWNWVPDPADPPNATLLALPADDGNEVAVVLELLETTYDEAAGRLTATVRLLGEAPDGDLRSLTSPTAMAEPRSFATGHLFVDDLAGIVPDDCQACDQDPSRYQARFQQCFNDPDYGNSCDYCASWVGCNGSLDTGSDECGVVDATC